MRVFGLGNVLSLLGLAVAACGGSGAEVAATTTSALSGPIDLRVTEADDHDTLPAADTAAQIVVTISRIDARIEDGRPDSDEGVWTTVSSQTTTVDLLSLRGGAFASFGSTQLPAGKLEALRLFLSPSPPSYVVTADGVRHGIAVSPGTQTWFKLASDFELAPCAEGHVTLEFAGKTSIAIEVGYGTWMLRPAIRVSDVVSTGACASLP
jgi:hypothetical protein